MVQMLNKQDFHRFNNQIKKKVLEKYYHKERKIEFNHKYFHISFCSQKRMK